MTTREDTHGCDYFTSPFLLPQPCNNTLPAANRWRHDVAEAEGRPTPAPKLGVEDVYAKLTPTAVNIPHRGNIGVEFDDGYMFGGHPVTVKTKRDGTPTSIEMDV